jgi:hypothetical protein
LTNFRRVALAVVLLSGLLGLISRLAGWNEAAFADPSLNLKHIAAGQNVGPFLADGTEGRDLISLRLLSPQCKSAIFLTASYVDSHLPEKLIAYRYPPTGWRSIYVHQGQASTQIPNYPLRDYFRRKVWLTLLSPLDLSETTLFAFHIPIECSGDESAAIAGATAIIASAATANS